MGAGGGAGPALGPLERLPGELKGARLGWGGLGVCVCVRYRCCSLPEPRSGWRCLWRACGACGERPGRVKPVRVPLFPPREPPGCFRAGPVLLTASPAAGAGPVRPRAPFLRFLWISIFVALFLANGSLFRLFDVPDPFLCHEHHNLRIGVVWNFNLKIALTVNAVWQAA